MTYFFLRRYSAARASPQAPVRLALPKKLLQKLTKDEKEALSDIGITLESAGTLKLDEKKFLEATPTKIASIFSENSEFTQKVNFYAGKIYKAARHIDTQA